MPQNTANTPTGEPPTPHGAPPPPPPHPQGRPPACSPPFTPIASIPIPPPSPRTLLSSARYSPAICNRRAVMTDPIVIALYAFWGAATVVLVVLLFATITDWVR